MLTEEQYRRLVWAERHATPGADERDLLKVYCPWTTGQTVQRRGILEAFCEHGIGHTIYAYEWSGEKGTKYEGVHGCDGCCSGKDLSLPEDDAGLLVMTDDEYADMLDFFLTHEIES